MLQSDDIGNWPGKTIGGDTHPALWHMLDVGAVAARLIQHRPVTARADWDRAIVFLIVLHDLGKISEGFRDQIRGRDAPVVYHSELSFALMLDHDAQIADRIGGTPLARRMLYAAVAGHHGTPPELDSGSGKHDHSLQNAIGDQAHAVAGQMIDAVADLFPGASLEGMKGAMAKMLSWQVSGLTVQADWIGSNEVWFGAKPPTIPIGDYWEIAQEAAKVAVSEAGLHHAKPRADPAILPHGAQLRPMQVAVQEAALPEGPVMAMIEDATGAGKTEAALILASRMMAAGKAQGVFFALPTMATSNAMLARIEAAAPGLFEGRPSLGLSHGRARQNALFQRIRGNDGSDPAEPVTCGQWLADDRRRILLADIGVGTVDQALLSVLPTRFNTLRLWALSGRILIVDEAHSYDPFMAEELCGLLRFHAMLGGSCILMTATLPKTLRDRFAAAFQRGLGQVPHPVPGDAYPQLTVISEGIETHNPAPVPATCRDIAVQPVTPDDAVDLIRDAVAEGAACVWVRNAVDDAIAAVEALRAAGIEAALLHARFTVADRLVKEQALQARFGRDGTDRQGRVLVATQVVEASLDLDFDLMISDLAPIGSLIQRAGRLWRHMDLRPAAARPVPGPRLHVISPDPDHVEDGRWLHRVLPSGAFVYALPDQWRTARALSRAGMIRAPGGLRDLIEAVHGPDPEDVPAALESAEQERIAETMIKQQMALHQLLRPGNYLDDAQKVRDEDRVTTRLGAPQVTLWLARQDAAGLAPYADSWEASELRVSRARYERAGGVDQEVPEIAALKSRWPEWRRQTVQIVPVAEGGEITETLRYSEELGLVSGTLNRV